MRAQPEHQVEQVVGAQGRPAAGDVGPLTTSPLARPAEAPKPAALVADGIPPVPDEIPASMRPYGESRSAVAQGWDAKTGALIVSTRFGNTAQLHTVSGPLMARRQMTFEAERWGDVQSGGAVLTRFVRPRDLDPSLGPDAP